MCCSGYILDHMNLHMYSSLIMHSTGCMAIYNIILVLYIVLLIFIAVYIFPLFVHNTQAHYAFCFEVLNTFVDSFETYANFKEVV